MSRRELIVDIETAPAIVYTWSLFKPTIGLEQIIKHPRMICWAASWLGESKVIFRSEYHDSTDDMLATLHGLLDEADVVTTYNGDRFDIKHINREFAEHGLRPPAPFVSVDLYKVVNRNFMFLSGKLANVTSRLNLTGKLHHSGFRMWRDCLGDNGPEEQEKAWRLMRRYSKQDVSTTTELRVELAPYIKNLPAAHLYSSAVGDELVCPSCESTDWIQRGFRYTKTRAYQRFSCKACGVWFSDTRSSAAVGVAL